MQDKRTKLWQWLKNKKRTVWFEYGALALMIMLPLLLPGYILTLDMVFTPTFTWPTELTNTYPLEALLWLLHLILPGDIIEKIVLFIILLFSGVGMHTLVRSINVKHKISPDIWSMALYFAGVFYMINPFTYSRFMAGQWMLLLGYAMIPFFIKALLKFFMLPSYRTLIWLVVWTFAAVTASIHHAGIVLLIAVLVPVLASVFGYWRSKDHVKKFFAWSGVGILVLFVLSSYWLIPALLGDGAIGTAVSSMDQAAHFKAFATNGAGALGAVGEVIRLQGFWAEPRQLYTLPQSIVSAWGVLFLLIWIVVAVGAIKAWKTHRLIVAFALSCIMLGIVLAASPLISWISHLVPLAAGYREPDKFASLIAIGYAILGVFGAAFIAQWATDRFNELGGQAAIVVCLLLPLAVTPSMLWGFGGQLSPRQYPSGWYAMNRTLKNRSDLKKVLFLPWHQYMAYGFSGRIIANPAQKFFEVPMVISDDPEFSGLPPTNPDPEKRAVGDALGQPKALAKVLRAYSINYILLAKETDDTNDDYLNKLPGIQLVSENDNLKLYRLEP